MAETPPAKRPGFQYVTIRDANPSVLDATFRNHADNIRWLSDNLDSLREAFSKVEKETASTVAAGDTSGKYQPLAIAGVNVTQAIASEAQWMKIGNVVGVSGVIVVTPTATGPCNTDITLPFAAQFTDRVQ